MPRSGQRPQTAERADGRRNPTCTSEAVMQACSIVRRTTLALIATPAAERLPRQRMQREQAAPNHPVAAVQRRTASGASGAPR
jgi:hypothetical protein